MESRALMTECDTGLLARVVVRLSESHLGARVGKPRYFPSISPAYSLCAGLALLFLMMFSSAGLAQTAPTPPTNPSDPAGVNISEAKVSDVSNSTSSSGTPTTPTSATASTQIQLPDLTKKENFSSAMQIIILLTVLSLAPAILIMMTSFTRIIIVLSLLRQALGTAQLPPNQILIGLSMFMTFVVMGPTWQRINSTALQPYLDGKIDQKSAMTQAQVPLRDFMIAQIRSANNDEDVYLFADFAHEKPQTWKDVSFTSLVPGFMLSELKTAFLLGFKVYLPFLVVDLVISTILVSMGMMMLPPALISLPFKLLLFVLVDGWHLITSSLMGSFIT